MQPTIAIFVLTGIILFQTLISVVDAVSHPNVSASTFCYDDPSCSPSTWGGVCQTGKEQSPINIEINHLQVFTPTRFILNREYLTQLTHRFFAQNNGHTAQFELTSNSSDLESDFLICDGHLDGCYRFAQFHFHWGPNDSVGSEHTVNGKRYPLELHAVHYRANYSSLAGALAANDREAVAVMAVFYKIGREDGFLTPIIEALEAIKAPGVNTEFDLPLQIADLYPRSGKFAHYNGSLTTPTCDEKVIWSVFIKPLQLSEKQMSRFRKLSNAEGNSDFNFRPTQPLNGRTVEYYMSLGLNLPEDQWREEHNEHSFLVRIYDKLRKFHLLDLVGL